MFIQNAEVRLIFNLPKCSHVTSLLHDLHWLPVVACIRCKTMVLAIKAINGTAPVYLQELVKPNAPAQALHSTASAGWLVEQIPNQSLSSSTEDSRLICSDFTSTLHSMISLPLTCRFHRLQKEDFSLRNCPLCPFSSCPCQPCCFNSQCRMLRKPLIHTKERKMQQVGLFSVWAR